MTDTNDYNDNNWLLKSYDVINISIIIAMWIRRIHVSNVQPRGKALNIYFVRVRGRQTYSLFVVCTYRKKKNRVFLERFIRKRRFPKWIDKKHIYVYISCVITHPVHKHTYTHTNIFMCIIYILSSARSKHSRNTRRVPKIRVLGR